MVIHIVLEWKVYAVLHEVGTCECLALTVEWAGVDTLFAQLSEGENWRNLLRYLRYYHTIGADEEKTWKNR